MNKDKVYLKGYVVGHTADTLGYKGLLVQLENLDVVEIDKNLVHEDINKPQPIVPQFVADWYEENKDDFEYNLWDWVSSKDEPEKIHSEFAFWVNDVENNPIQTLVNMHQFGYTVEKEKRYLVKIIGITNYNSYLNYHKGENKWTIESRMETDGIRTAHTRKELEEADFGWVFDCEGIEIEEVE